MSREKTHERIGPDIGRLLVACNEHLDAACDKKGAEEVEHPVELLHDGSAGADHDAAQEQDGDDTPDERAILINARDRKRAEDQRNDKDIVDRQRLFDDEAGIIFKTEVGALLGPHPKPERKRDADIEKREQ